MSIIASKTLHLTLETLPPFPVSNSPGNKAERVYHYLMTLITERLTSPVGCLELPSIAELSTVFSCSNLDLYDALQALQASGYEYQFEKAGAPILLWQPPHEKVTKITSIRRS
jgi:hypothetical protein